MHKDKLMEMPKMVETVNCRPRSFMRQRGGYQGQEGKDPTAVGRMTTRPNLNNLACEAHRTTVSGIQGDG